MTPGSSGSESIDSLYSESPTPRGDSHHPPTSLRLTMTLWKLPPNLRENMDNTMMGGRGAARPVPRPSQIVVVPMGSQRADAQFVAMTWIWNTVQVIVQSAMTLSESHAPAAWSLMELRRVRSQRTRMRFSGSPPMKYGDAQTALGKSKPTMLKRDIATAKWTINEPLPIHIET